MSGAPLPPPCRASTLLPPVRASCTLRSPGRFLRRSATPRRATIHAAAQDQQQQQQQQGVADLATAKRVLKRSCYLSDRGAGSTPEIRGVVEEAQVAVEAFGAPSLDALEGLWRLIYTNAFDVTGIVDFGRTAPLLKVGGIYQEYSSVQEGVVKNIVDFGLPPFLEVDKGLRFTVRADYEPRSGSRMAFNFRSAGLSDLRISSALESLIAPALLPRDQIQQAVLTALQEFNIDVPLQTRPPSLDGRPQRALRPNFQVTFVDEEVFIGRAPQGSFIFLKEKGKPPASSVAAA
mmetsp:Transcript_19373/g.50525  ORF Transcript_19373/g.50525 Transcript_19373/m.50525 type:complete len:291 (+) Transcript_19373:90-962(+)